MRVHVAERTHRAQHQSSSATPLTIINPDEGTQEERMHAKYQFEQFVLNTWKHLVLAEKAEAGGGVSISIFCRLDIGLVEKDGRLLYFVNEVERSLTASLWISAMPDGQHGIFADTFAVTFHDWLVRMSDPQQ